MKFELAVFSDYICPWCYVGQGVVEKLQAEHGILPDWRPFYLYWDTPPEGRELPPHVLRARAAGSEERLSRMATSYGLKFSSTKRIFNTRLAHEATEHARGLGRAAEFHRVVFRQVYADGLDISQWEVLRAAAQEAGLNPDDMQQAVQGGQYTAQVAAKVQQAYQLGVSGVPTYVINNRYAVVGAQPYEAFQEALQQISKQEADPSD